MGKLEEYQTNAARLMPFAWVLGTVFWVAWILLIYTGECLNPTYHALQTVVMQQYAVSTAALVLTIVVAATHDSAAYDLLRKGRFVLLAGFVASLATVGCIAATYLQLPLPAFLAFAALTGMGTAVVALKLFSKFAELGIRTMVIYASLSLITAFLCYNFFLQLPGLIEKALLSLLPLCASAFSLTAASEGGFEADNGSQTLPPGFKSLIGGLFVLGFAASFMRGHSIGRLSADLFADERILVSLWVTFLGIVFVALALVASEKFSFTRFIYHVFLAISIVLFALWLTGDDSIVVLSAFDCCSAAISSSSWILLSAIAFKTSASSIKVVGYGSGAVYGGSLVGWAGGEIVYGILPIGAIGIAMIALVLFAEFFLMNEKMLEKMLDVPVEKADFALPENTQESLVAYQKPGFRDHCAQVAEQYNLSRREREVFMLMAKGIDARTIGERLFISYNTVRTHVRNIYAKLGVHTHAEFVQLIASDKDLP